MDDMLPANVTDIRPWLDDPKLPVEALLGGMLKTPDAAQDFLKTLRERLASAGTSKSHTTDEVRAALDRHRRSRRAAAA